MVQKSRGTSPQSPKAVLTHPSEPATDSIGHLVSFSVKMTQECLETACRRGVADVFAMTGRNKGTFPGAYDQYSSQITALEENICSYLLVREPVCTYRREHS